MLQIKTIRHLNCAWIAKGSKNKNAPILFFLHGFPDDADTWSFQLDHFAKDYLVVAPYFPGAGPSQPPKEKKRFHLNSILLDHLSILREIDPLERKKVCVVAHDIGAIYGWNLARALKNRLDKLVMINGPSLEQFFSRYKNISQVKKSWYIYFFQMPVIPEWALNRWKTKFFPKSHHDKNISLHMIEQYRQAFLPGLKTLKIKPEKITHPVLCLWGKDDPYLDAPSYQEMDLISTNYTLRVLPGKHWLHKDEPKKINQLIEEFLGNNNEAKAI